METMVVNKIYRYKHLILRCKSIQSKVGVFQKLNENLTEYQSNNIFDPTVRILSGNRLSELTVYEV